MRFPLSQMLGFACFLLVLSRTEAIIAKPENSLVGPYIAGGENLAWWDLTGSAQLAETAIRLTTDEPEKQGAIWNNFPNIIMDWEFHMQFHIHGKGVHLNGEGLAIWYVREPLIAGPIFGYRDYFTGLGVFIDTFEDQAHPHHHKHPYISAVVNNGSQHYEHDEQGTVAQVGGCHVPVRNLEWPTRIAVSYIAEVLSVYFNADGTEAWSECFRSPGVQLPTGYYFGVSASTGMVSDNHDVISITTLDMNIPGKPYLDRTHIVPNAMFVEIPARPKSSEEVSDEDPHKVEVKREAHPEEAVAEAKVHIPHPQKHELPEEHVAEPPKPEPRTSDAEEEASSKPASFYRKALYVAGVGVLLYVAFALFKQYNERRKERIQKRLY